MDTGWQIFPPEAHTHWDQPLEKITSRQCAVKLQGQTHTLGVACVAGTLELLALSEAGLPGPRFPTHGTTSPASTASNYPGNQPTISITAPAGSWSC